MLGLLLVIMVMTIWWRKVASPSQPSPRCHCLYKRSAGQRYAVRRLCGGLTVEQKLAIMEQVPARLNKFYHTGFKYESSRQFCSKFVFDIYKEALCIPVGDIETFEELLHSNPDAKLAFWKFWFLGSIPWDRKTVTPASLWQHPNLELISACGIETPQREAEGE